MKDLKQVYQANTEEQAMSQLAAFSEKWEKQYPTAVHSWEENWDILSTYFDYTRGDPKDHLYDECDRRTKPTIQKK